MSDGQWLIALAESTTPAATAAGLLFAVLPAAVLLTWLLVWGYRIVIFIFVSGPRMHDGGTIDAVQAMTDDELHQSITALHITHDRLRRAGNQRDAARVASDRSMCLSELAQRASCR